jgi:hypothetical protein
MPKGKEMEAEEPAEVVVEYPFTLRSLTLTDVSKVPGAERYSSREFGVPYVTFELDWPGKLKLFAKGDIADPAVMGLAVRELMRWLKATGAKVGQEIVADIKLDQADAMLGGVPSVDINEL